MDDELVKVNISWTVDDTNPDVRALISVLERERKQAAARIEADARRIAELEGLVKEARGIVGRISSALNDAFAACMEERALLARMGGSDGSA
jgi:hypothetical protein